MRRLILENIQDEIGDKVIAKSSVHINRGVSASTDELPVINLNTISEEISVYGENPKSYQRSFLFTIECVAAADTYELLDERIEILTELVEEKIESSNFLNSLQRETNLNRIEFDYDNEADSPVGSSILYYSCSRVIDAEWTDEKLKSLNEIRVSWNLTNGPCKENVSAENNFSNLNKK